VRDLERLTAFLSENKVQQIILAGFSDRHEDAARLIEGSFDSNYDQNHELSCKRAEVVKEELRSRGITVADVLCVGSEMPMASNATEFGRDKNRRVEVWVK
jgi:phosphate transport system substrate-binding protein